MDLLEKEEGGVLSNRDRTDLQLQLDAFIVQHAVHHRPIVLVSSGGTAADLEVSAVRSIENFSTGLRGAVSVEEFLRRGYAVIHLRRSGSAAPYARVLQRHVGVDRPDHALDCDSFSKLFAATCAGGGNEYDDDELVRTVLQQEEDDEEEQQQQQQRDPWLTADDPTGGGTASGRNRNSQRAAATTGGSSGLLGSFAAVGFGADNHNNMTLHRNLVHSTRVRKALQERSAFVVRENRLFTVPFRSVEEYLIKLKLSAECLSDCQCLAMFYLAAAVSDFYIPRSERSEHKIQSHHDDHHEHDDDGTSSSSSEVDGRRLVLHLKPVPKTLHTLRSTWAPEAFVVTFKLETDEKLLRTKAERAVEKSGCHMVVGNLLHTRHQTVWVLSPDDQRDVRPVSASDWSLMEIHRPKRTVTGQQGLSSNDSTRNDDEDDDCDSLESSLMDFVVQQHFEYISWHFHRDSSSGNSEGGPAGVRAAERASRLLREKKQKVQRQLALKQLKSVALEIAGVVIAVYISYTLNTTLQRRLRGGGGGGR